MSQHCPEVVEYLAHVDALYASVKRWVGELDAVEAESPAEMNEEDYGKYSVPRLVLKTREGKELARLDPAGAGVVLAFGGIDLHGRFRSDFLYYFKGRGFLFERPPVNGIPSAPTPAFEGIDGDGWYWVDSTPSLRAHRVDEDGFRELLELVSDYGR